MTDRSVITRIGHMANLAAQSGAALVEVPTDQLTDLLQLAQASRCSVCPLVFDNWQPQPGPVVNIDVNGLIEDGLRRAGLVMFYKAETGTIEFIRGEVGVEDDSD